MERMGHVIRLRPEVIDEYRRIHAEVFATNASWGALPITRIEQKEIGAGAVGPLTSDIAAALEV